MIWIMDYTFGLFFSYRLMSCLREAWQWRKWRPPLVPARIWLPDVLMACSCACALYTYFSGYRDWRALVGFAGQVGWGAASILVARRHIRLLKAFLAKLNGTDYGQ